MAKIVEQILNALYKLVRGGGLVVSVLTAQADDLNSNPTEVYSFYSVQFILKELKCMERDQGWPILNDCFE